MSQPHSQAHPAPVDRSEEGQDFASYLWGFVLALTLTLAVFALVHWHATARVALLITLGLLGLLQVIVHFHFFLHIGFRHKREDLQLLLFSGLLLLIMVAGTVWIMASLGRRMTVPAAPASASRSALEDAEAAPELAMRARPATPVTSPPAPCDVDRSQTDPASVRAPRVAHTAACRPAAAPGAPAR